MTRFVWIISDILELKIYEKLCLETGQPENVTDICGFIYLFLTITI